MSTTYGTMPTLQIRGVLEDVKAILKKRAADAGQSLSEYALERLRTSAEYPTYRELTERIREVHLPHQCLTETTSAVRALVLGRQLSLARGDEAIATLLDFGGVRRAPAPHLPRVWELRHHLSAYDALNVALAETLDAHLFTCDARLARASGHQARGVVVGA